MRLIQQQQQDNKLSPWSVDDDQLLYESHKAGQSIEDLCAFLKRGTNGIKKRIQHLQDPKHNAHKRLFGVVDAAPVTSLRPCIDVINRILYDPNLDAADFSFVYLDRFDGSVEASAAAANGNIKGPARKLIKAVPEHRIQQIKYKARTVWDKDARVDLVFGSTPRPIESADALEIDFVQPIDEAFDEVYDVYTAENEDAGDGGYLVQTVEGVSVDAWTDDGGEGDWLDDANDRGIGRGSGGNVCGSGNGGMTIFEVIAGYDQWALSQERQRTAAVEQAIQTKIFVDLDGGLVDFTAGVMGLFNGKKPSEVSPKVLWSRLGATDRFYEDLPWTVDGRHLWGVLAPLRPTILTGCPRGGWAEGAKRAWVGRELGVDVEVITCMSKDKHKFCPPPRTPADSGSGEVSANCDTSTISSVSDRTAAAPGAAILIDDRASAGPLWEAAGGRGVLHTDTASTLRQLATLLPLTIPVDGTSANDL